MAPHEHDHRGAQTSGERAALAGDVASQALNEALGLSFFLLKIVMVLVVVLFFCSGIFRVKQYEQAIVLRFGKLVTYIDRETKAETPLFGPGLHFAWPFLIDEIVRLPVKQIIEEPINAFWYKEKSADTPGSATPAGIKQGEGGFSLTGDANILHSRWRVQYSIARPEEFIGRLADPSTLAEQGPKNIARTLTASLLRNAVIHTIASYHVDDAYRRQKDRLRKDVRALLRRRLEQLDVGIELKDVFLDAIVPPRQAKEAFDRVIEAEQENRQLIHQAEGYANETINAAKGKASAIVAKAEAYKVRVKEQADADADYIKDLLATYPQDPQMLNTFLEQRLIEVLEETLEAADEVFVVEDRGPQGRREIRLLINRDPKIQAKPKPQPEAEPPSELPPPAPPE